MGVSRLLYAGLLAISSLSLVAAETRTYNFTASWVLRNPDGLFERPVIGINGQWPLPRIEANVNDTVIVNLYNGLGNATTSIHFHGLYMNGTNHMDGVAQATQCPVAPGSTFTYNFTIQQPGTYWYHSHVDGQYPNGMRGPLIIHDTNNPFADQYDEELVLTVSDWYHEEMTVLLKKFLSVANPTGAEPIPDSNLMNDTQNATIPVQPGKTYFIRIINMGAFVGQYIWIENHSFHIIEVDGVYTNAANASMIYISAAQRYGILLTVNNETTSNFPIVASMDQSLLDYIPSTLNLNVTSWFVTNPSADNPAPALLEGAFDVDQVPFDDATLVAEDGMELLENPAMTITVDVIMDDLGNGVNYAFFNNITYVQPVVPTLYTVLNAGELATDPEIYGTWTHSFVLGYDEVIELVLNNHDTGRHPMHMHGHAFQVLYRSDEDAGDWDPAAVTNGSVTFPPVPMRRDTFTVRPNGHWVARFRSNNPGVWLFHCHIEWHVSSGLVLNLVEAPLELQKSLTIPEDHYAACAALDPPMPITGNAAGNTQDYTSLIGQNIPPNPLPAGFTPRGIVALVFSCIAGVLGIATITWYGLGEMGAVERARAERSVQKEASSAGLHDSQPSGGVTTSSNTRTTGAERTTTGGATTAPATSMNVDAISHSD